MSKEKMIDIDLIQYRGYTIVHLPTSEGKNPVKLDFAFYKTESPMGDRIKWLAGAHASAMDMIDDIVGPFP